MLDEIREYEQYSYKFDEKFDANSWFYTRLKYKNLQGDFTGLKRAMTIVARHFLFKNNDNPTIDDINKTREIIKAWLGFEYDSNILNDNEAEEEVLNWFPNYLFNACFFPKYKEMNDLLDKRIKLKDKLIDIPDQDAKRQLKETIEEHIKSNKSQKELIDLVLNDKCCCSYIEGIADTFFKVEACNTKPTVIHNSLEDYFESNKKNVADFEHKKYCEKEKHLKNAIKVLKAIKVPTKVNSGNKKEVHITEIISKENKDDLYYYYKYCVKNYNSYNKLFKTSKGKDPYGENPSYYSFKTYANVLINEKISTFSFDELKIMLARILVEGTHAEKIKNKISKAEKDGFSSGDKNKTPFLFQRKHT